MESRPVEKPNERLEAYKRTNSKEAPDEKVAKNKDLEYFELTL